MTINGLALKLLGLSLSVLDFCQFFLPFHLFSSNFSTSRILLQPHPCSTLTKKFYGKQFSFFLFFCFCHSLMWFNSSKKEEGKVNHFSTCFPLKVFLSFRFVLDCWLQNYKWGREFSSFSSVYSNCTTCCFRSSSPFLALHIFPFPPIYHAPSKQQHTEERKKFSSVKDKHEKSDGVPLSFFLVSLFCCLSLSLYIWRRFIVLCRRWWSIIHFGGSKTQMELNLCFFFFDWLMKKTQIETAFEFNVDLRKFWRYRFKNYPKKSIRMPGRLFGGQ